MKALAKRLSVFAVILAVAMAFTFSVSQVDAFAATGTPGKVTLTSVTSVNSTTLSVKWNKASGANKYQVYRATSQNGTYKLVATTTGTTYKSTKLKIGQKYYFKVRAINGSKKGAFSAKKYAVPTLKTPTAIVDESNFGIIEVCIEDEESGITGMDVYRSTSKTSGYKKVASVESGFWFGYFDGSLDPNKTYYYKVKVTKTVGGRTYESAFSTAKSIRIELDEELSDTVKTKELKQDNGNLLVELNTTSEEPLMVAVRATFKDEDGAVISTVSRDCGCVAASGCGYVFFDCPSVTEWDEGEGSYVEKPLDYDSVELLCSATPYFTGEGDEDMVISVEDKTEFCKYKVVKSTDDETVFGVNAIVKVENTYSKELEVFAGVFLYDADDNVIDYAYNRDTLGPSGKCYITEWTFAENAVSAELACSYAFETEIDLD